jgi:hypothetical protein
MMDPELQQHSHNAIAHIERILDGDRNIRHIDVQTAVNAVVAFRDRLIEKQREDNGLTECLNQANAFVSLAYGAEFPLSGLHRHRLEQVRQGMLKLIQANPL